MPAKTSYRNHRNNPYILDDLATALHRSAPGVIWRFRTELATVAGVSAAFDGLARVTGLAQAGLFLLGTVATLALLPGARRFILRRAWCVITRHRIQRVCFETRMHTRSGRLPLILRISPTSVGERALIWCRAGICFEDFEAHAPEVAAACYAREARMEKSRRWAQLVTVQVVRRDTLATHVTVASGLAPSTVPKASGTTTTAA
jgi:hypothetical protein